MKKIVFAAMPILASVAFGQAPPKERDTLQALLDEVHQLRLSVEGMTGASQRVQIALYSLQLQDAAVTRATQRLDAARNRCRGLEEARQAAASHMRELESRQNAPNLPESEVKVLKLEIPDFQRALEMRTAESQACQSVEAESASQLRNDQGKLSELQDRITRLDKALEQLSTAGK